MSNKLTLKQAKPKATLPSNAVSTETVSMVTPTGETVQIPASEVGTFSAQGFQFDSPELRQKKAEEEHYGSTTGEFIAGGLGALRGGTLGLSDVAIQQGEKAGLLPEGSTEGVRKYEEHNPDASTAGEMASFLLPGVGEIGALGKVAKVAKAGGIGPKAVSEVGSFAARQAEKIVGEKLGTILSPSAKLAAESALLQAGSNISDLALGNRDYTAESILANVGSSAVLGGGLGGAIPIVGKLGRATIEKAAEMPIISSGLKSAIETVNTFFDPQRSTQLFTGAMLKELKQDTGERFQKAVEWLRENGFYKSGAVDLDLATGKLAQVEKGAILSQEAALERLNNLTDKAGQAIGDTLKAADKAALDAGIAPDSATWFAADQAKLESRVNKWRKTRQITPGEATNLKAEIDDVVSGLAETNGSLEQMHALRKGLDAKIGPKNFDGLKDEYIEIVKDLRKSVSEKIQLSLDEYAEKGIFQGSEKWTNLNQLYSNLKQIELPLDRAIGRANANVNVGGLRWRDLLAGGIGSTIGSAIGGPVGAAIGAGAGVANKLMQTDKGLLVRASIGEQLATLGWAEKQTLNNSAKLQEAISAFLKTSADKAGQAGDKAFKILSPAIAKGLVEPSVKEKQQAQAQWFTDRQNELIKVQMDPQGTLRHLREQVRPLQDQDEELGNALVTKQMTKYAYLFEKMPKDPRQALNPLKSNWKPTDTDLNKFKKIVDVAQDPDTVTKDINAGRLTKVQVETLRDLWPETYQKLVTGVAKEVVSKGYEIPYSKRIQMAILFDAPLDYTMRPAFIQTMQGIWHQDPSQKQEQPSQSRPINATKIANNNTSDADRAASK